MSKYDEVKEKAPEVLAAVKTMEAYLNMKRYDDYGKMCNKVLDLAVNLVQDYPQTLAAYVVATNAFGSLITYAEKYAEVEKETIDFPFTYAGIQCALTMGFLSENAESDEYCANLLLGVLQRLLFTFLPYAEATGKFGNDSPALYSTYEYLQTVANLNYSAMENLKKKNPSSPLIPPLVSFFDQFGYEAKRIEFSQFNDLLDYLSALEKQIFE